MKISRLFFTKSFVDQQTDLEHYSKFYYEKETKFSGGVPIKAGELQR